MIFLSSNGFSHDMQVQDVVNWLGIVYPDTLAAIKVEFPEIDRIVMDGASFDTDKMGVDVEWSSWLTDRIEQDTDVYWWEGEPVMPEDGDTLKDEEDNTVDDEDAADTNNWPAPFPRNADEQALYERQDKPLVWASCRDGGIGPGWLPVPPPMRVTLPAGTVVESQDGQRLRGRVVGDGHPLSGWVWVAWQEYGTYDELIEDLTIIAP